MRLGRGLKDAIFWAAVLLVFLPAAHARDALIKVQAGRR
jgi:hypothetical protein